MNRQLTGYRATVSVLLLGGLMTTGASLRADTLELLWQLLPGSRTYITDTTSRTERGVAINPVTGNVLLVSRAGSPQVYVLSGADGSDGSDELGQARTLQLTGEDGSPLVAGGTFVLNLVGVADDGVVYAANLTLNSSTADFRIYRWSSEATDAVPTLAYAGNPVADTGATGNDLRFGDTLAVRRAGTATEIAVGSYEGKYIVVFTTTDGATFEPRVHVAADCAGKIRHGLAFGAGETVWAKRAVNPVRLVQLNANGTAETIATWTPPSTYTSALAASPGDTLLALLDYYAHKFVLYNTLNPSGFAVQSELGFGTSNVNDDGTGAASFAGDRLALLETKNGLMLARVVKAVTPDPPVIDPGPASMTVYAGARITLGIGVSGTPPFTYQWYRDGDPLPGETGASLTLASVRSDQAGAYSVSVKNAAAEVTSEPGVLAVRTPVSSGHLTPLWDIAPGTTHPYVNSDNTQRGLAYNPVTDNLILVSRTAGNQIAVLNAATGEHRHFLETKDDQGAEIIAGAGGDVTFPVNMVGVSEDGVVYVGNLATSGFAIYRWANDGPGTIPSASWVLGLEELNPQQRWGDTFDVRGRGNSTQILLGSRYGRTLALLTTFDEGATFYATPMDVAEAADGDFGLGLAFGAGDTAWGTAVGRAVSLLNFDATAMTASVARTFDATAMPLGLTVLDIDAVNHLLAGVALEVPDNIQLYDIAETETGPVLLDQELLLRDVTNGNGTGSVDFGGGRLYTLDSNNGLQAFTLDLNPQPPASPTLSSSRVSGGDFEFTLVGEAGVTYLIQRSRDLRTWDVLPSIEVTLEGVSSAAVRIPMAAESTQFVRAQVK
ncbi:MAG TPA: immunoglobulin domain-containing protein [Verrucomicrobiota bacterium]|nr:immunoglobulin domain-containing protein [Verrucomicrobiota bacterium]HNU51048.1 immunoglobulin domain-containing protein [Verrucomicrobiota bacterium]